MSPWDLWFIAGLVCVAALVALPWVVRSRLLVFASAFFGACLLPVANLLFLAPSGMAERYLHLAMIPVALTWGWAGQCWLRKSPGQRRLIWAVVLVAAVLCGARTIVRNRDWHSDARLFAAVLSHYPDNARAHDNLAFAYYQQGQYARAFHHYQRAVAIQPTRLRAHFNLGILHSAARRYEEAIASFKTALALNSTHVETHFNLGLTYQKAGRYEEAIGHYGTVLNLAPHHLKTHYNLGRAYERVGRIEERHPAILCARGVESRSDQGVLPLGRAVPPPATPRGNGRCLDDPVAPRPGAPRGRAHSSGIETRSRYNAFDNKDLSTYDNGGCGHGSTAKKRLDFGCCWEYFET